MTVWLAIFDVGFQEGFVLLVLALLMFGGELPDVLRKVGRVVGELKRSAQNLAHDLNVEIDDRPRLKPPGKPPANAIARGSAAAGGSAVKADAPAQAESSPAARVESDPQKDGAKPPDGPESAASE